MKSNSFRRILIRNIKIMSFGLDFTGTGVTKTLDVYITMLVLVEI